MPHERLRPEYHFDQDRIDALREIAPEAFADGKVNWASLKEAFGTMIEEDEADGEHFGLFWPGKREARRLASIPSTGTLVPVKGEGIDEDETGNIFIEGENLEVLKILRKSYVGRIKMIYIDPPYNTGNDFVYDDDFTEPLQDYLKRTGQIDGEGRPMTTNKKTDGRFHSKWLSMMYPRLRLARELLRDDGVIFVSVDDNEMQHLRILMNEVFGEEALIGVFIWKSRQNKDNRPEKGMSVDHEYVIAYGSSVRGDERKVEQYANPDNDSRGDWTSANMVGLATKQRRPNLHYDLVNPATKINYGCPKMGWRYDPHTLARLIQENRIIWPESPNGRPRRKAFLNELETDFTGTSSVIGVDVYTRDGTAEVNELFGYRAMDFPKPVKLLRELVLQGAAEGGIVLDFFAGSCTTGEAVIRLIAESEKPYQFILVQIPEPVDPDTEAAASGLRTISDIGKERLRRATSRVELRDSDDTRRTGFKTLILRPSHLKQWQNYHGESVEKLESLFDEHSTPLVDDWKSAEDGLFTEILLLEGFPLDSTVTVLSDYVANEVRRVECSFHENRLLVCLDDQVQQDTLENLDLADGDTFICLDSAIDDQTKTRLADKGLIKTI